jgi:Protein of unknown function (DUF3311)
MHDNAMKPEAQPWQEFNPVPRRPRELTRRGRVLVPRRPSQPVQFIAVLWPPFYNRLEPQWAGVPFFYQLLWVIIGAVLTAIVYFQTED